MSIRKEIMLTVCIVEILTLNCQVSFQGMTQHNDYMNTVGYRVSCWLLKAHTPWLHCFKWNLSYFRWRLFLS